MNREIIIIYDEFKLLHLDRRPPQIKSHDGCLRWHLVYKWHIQELEPTFFRSCNTLGKNRAPCYSDDLILVLFIPWHLTSSHNKLAIFAPSYKLTLRFPLLSTKSVKFGLHLWDEVHCDQVETRIVWPGELALPLPVLDELGDAADLLHVLARHLVALGSYSLVRWDLSGAISTLEATFNL